MFGSILRDIVKLGWPVLIAQVAVMINGVIDTVMAGRLSAADLAAVGIGASIYISIFVTLMGVLIALTPVVAQLGRSERRVAAARYVQGLLMPGQRKSVEPMAERLGVDPQGLQQFVSDSPWSDQAVWTVVRQQIIPHLERWKRGWWMRPGGSSKVSIRWGSAINTAVQWESPPTAK